MDATTSLAHTRFLGNITVCHTKYFNTMKNNLVHLTFFTELKMECYSGTLLTNANQLYDIHNLPRVPCLNHCFATVFYSTDGQVTIKNNYLYRILLNVFDDYKTYRYEYEDGRHNRDFIVLERRL